MPRPLTKLASLEILKRAGVEISTILDVGVQHGTPDLMTAFPNTPHVLFEPVAEYAARIAENYKAIPHQLHAVAVSDVTGEGNLQTLSVREGGGITHAVLGAQGRPVQVVRLDKIVPETGCAAPFLLKIDVEGVDIPGRILDGASGIMDQVSIVICEMVGSRFIDLASRIARHDFVLWDIVEACYYDDVFWQCDAVFVRRRDLQANPALRPMGIAAFDHKKWWESHQG